jgi:hypothetical protein
LPLRSFIPIAFVLLAVPLHAQEPLTVRVRKIHNLVFFQEGVKSDSLIKNRSDIFRMVIPDSLKGKIAIETDNAILRKTDSDSLVKIEYLPGLNYRTIYEPYKNKYVLVTMINGASDSPRGTVVIRIKIHRDVILQTSFLTPDK